MFKVNFQFSIWLIVGILTCHAIGAQEYRHPLMAMEILPGTGEAREFFSQPDTSFFIVHFKRAELSDTFYLEEAFSYRYKKNVICTRLLDEELKAEEKIYWYWPYPVDESAMTKPIPSNQKGKIISPKLGPVISYRIEKKGQTTDSIIEIKDLFPRFKEDTLCQGLDKVIYRNGRIHEKWNGLGTKCPCTWEAQPYLWIYRYTYPSVGVTKRSAYFVTEDGESFEHSWVYRQQYDSNGLLKEKERIRYSSRNDRNGSYIKDHFRNGKWQETTYWKEELLIDIERIYFQEDSVPPFILSDRPFEPLK